MQSLHAHPPTRVHTSKIIARASSSLSLSTILLLSVLVTSFPILLLLHLLRGTLTLVVQLFILRIDLGLAIIGFPTSTGTTSISTMPLLSKNHIVGIKKKLTSTQH